MVNSFAALVNSFTALFYTLQCYHYLESLHGLEGEDPGRPDAGVALEKVPHQARAELWRMWETSTLRGRVLQF